MNLDQKSKRKNVPYLPKKHEAVFFTKNDKKTIVKKEKNTLPPVKNVQSLGGGGVVTIITQRVTNVLLTSAQFLCSIQNMIGGITNHNTKFFVNQGGGDLARYRRPRENSG